MMSEDSFQKARQQLIEGTLRNAGIRDKRVLSAMNSVPREFFCEETEQERAYENRPLPIPCQQTISQPFIVALMCEALEVQPTDRVLEVGTGSGYSAAILAQLCDEVFSIERHPILAQQAIERFESLGYRNIHVRVGDGTLGWPEESPFDAIQVTAAGPQFPNSLIQQLAPGGRLVIPIEKAPGNQSLMKLIRVSEQELQTEDLGAVRFVPLIGDEAF